MILFHLTSLLSLLPLVAVVDANVEKITFTHSLQDSSLQPYSAGLLEFLSPLTAPLHTKLGVQAPNNDNQYLGHASWFAIHELKKGASYEIRIIWCATQPTTWELNIYTLADVLGSKTLESSLQSFTEQVLPINQTHSEDRPSEIFLQILAKADYRSSSANLMSTAPGVDVDIFLDPLFLHILPQSLVPQAFYVISIFLLAWFFSSFAWNCICIQSAAKSKTN